jgi:4-hydroxybenzoate polyprenyltransferase
MSSKNRNAWFSLLRPPNLPTVPGDPLAGWYLAGGTGGQAAIAAAVAASLFYLSGLILNDVADIEIDRRERPGRPLPSGRVGREAALRAGLLCGLAGLAVTCLAGPAVLGLGTLLLLAILVYTFATPRGSTRGMLTMGLCRALSVGLGIAAASRLPVPPAALLAAGGIGGYIAAVSWMAAGEAGDQTLDGRRWLPLLLAAGSLGGILWLAPAPPHLPVMLAIAATALLRLARLTQTLGRHPAPGQMPQAVGGYIRLLLLLQAAGCASRHAGLVPAALLILLMPVAAHLGKRFHAS